jgi:hypothetical protein
MSSCSALSLYPEREEKVWNHSDGFTKLPWACQPAYEAGDPRGKVDIVSVTIKNLGTKGSRRAGAPSPPVLVAWPPWSWTWSAVAKAQHCLLTFGGALLSCLPHSTFHWQQCEQR